MRICSAFDFIPKARLRTRRGGWRSGGARV